MQEFKRNSDTPDETRQAHHITRPSRNKDPKDNRQRILNLRPREVFLTDNQTDQTKSSNELRTVDVERL